MEDANEPPPHVADPVKLQTNENGSNHSTADMISTDGEFEERLPLDDDDIEKAAEQVVDEWTERLQGSGRNVYDEAAANEGVGEVGAMNHELPAGGYEEVVMGYDETENAELIEEEVYDESYSEELVFDDDDMMIDDVVEEVMEEAASIINQEEQQQPQAPEPLQEDLQPEPQSNDNRSEEVLKDDLSEMAQNEASEASQLPADPELQEEDQVGDEPPSPNEEAQGSKENSSHPEVETEEPPKVHTYPDLDGAESLKKQQSSSTIKGSDVIPLSTPPIATADNETRNNSQGDSHRNDPASRAEDYAHESSDVPVTTLAQQKVPQKAARFKSQPPQKRPTNTPMDTPPQAVLPEPDDSSAAIPDPDIESAMDVPSPGDRKRKDDDEYDSSSDESDDEDDDGFLLCVMLCACLCLVAIILAIVLPIVILRRKNAVEPTLMPSLSPTTNVPTMMPTSTILSWVSTVEDVHGPEFSQFGSAIALDENFYIVGAPKDNTTGAVYSARFNEPHWDLLPPVYGEDEDDSFGAAVDVLDGHMIVGAPERKANGTLTMVGQAYLFVFQPRTETWVRVGPALQGDEDIFAAGGEFGKAVAVGLVGRLPRVAIGAPRHSKDGENLESGKVYTFESNGKSWKSLDSTKKLFGKSSNDWFGASVDMTNSGNRFIVGAPGTNEGAAGYIQIYEWDGSEWIVDFEATGNDGDNFGSAVASLTDSGTIFVVGAPGHSGGRGRIVVYRRLSKNTYLQLGPDIVGDPNDMLGRSGSINGGLEDGSIVLVFASLSGEVKTFTFEENSNTWLQRALPLVTGYNTVNVDYSEEDGLLVADADKDKALLYEPSDVTVTSIDTFEGPPNRPIKYVPATASPTMVPTVSS